MELLFFFKSSVDKANKCVDFSVFCVWGCVWEYYVLMFLYEKLTLFNLLVKQWFAEEIIDSRVSRLDVWLHWLHS